jgi:heme/copper-type cytochrome/quinol oxidase subunit 3
MTEGPYLTLPAVSLILAGVLVLAVLSSLVFEVSGLGRRDATVVFWLLLLAIWLGAVFVVGLLRP